MLDMCRTQQLTDIIHNSIAYSGIEREIIGTPIFNRLHHVLQSSLVYLTFSSNKVKRFEHSTGVMYLAGEIFYYSVCNAKPEISTEFLNCVSQEIAQWNSTLTHLPYVLPEVLKKYLKGDLSPKQLVPTCKLYNQYTPGNLDQSLIFAYYVIFQSIRLIGALHDVGHLPYSHVIEHALDNLYDRVSSLEIKNEQQQSFIDIMDRYRSSSMGKKHDTPLHEAIGEKLIDKIFDCITDELPRSADPNNIFLACVIEFTKRIIHSRPSQRSLYSELHLIVDGVLDADRLDFCSRDTFCAGIRKDIFPYSRFISTYQLMKEKYEDYDKPLIESNKDHINPSRVAGFFFCPAAKSTREISDLLERRWRIYTDMNYHHRVHKHETLMEEVIVRLGMNELEDPLSIPTSLPDSLPLKVYSIWRLVSLIDSNAQMLEYQIIQMDDSWLDTLLKNEFFYQYKQSYYSTIGNACDAFWHQFEELISAKKHYMTLFKRASQFMDLDQQFFAKFVETYKNNMIPETVSDRLGMRDISEKDFNSYYTDQLAFFTERIFMLISMTVMKKIMSGLRNELNSSIYKPLMKQYHVQDCLFRLCDINSGCNTRQYPVYVANDDGEPVLLDRYIPNLDESFRRERSLSPQFHVYYLPEYDMDHNALFAVNKKGLLDLIANILLEKTLETLNQQYNKDMIDKK